MPLRLIAVILCIGLLIVFIGINLDNTCDVSFGFITFKAVPVFLTILTSFTVGLLVSLPALFIRPRTKKKLHAQEAQGKGRKKAHRDVRPGGVKKGELEDGSYGVD